MSLLKENYEKYRDLKKSIQEKIENIERKSFKLKKEPKFN